MGLGKKWAQEEDEIVRQYAGVIPAADIAEILGRPKNGVHHRIKRLGLDGHLHGESHWNARLSGLQAAVIRALHSGGFTPEEIYQVLNAPSLVTKAQIEGIAIGRNWRRVG